MNSHEFPCDRCAHRTHGMVDLCTCECHALQKKPDVSVKVQGERERVKQTLRRLESAIDATKIALKQLEAYGIPFDPGAIQAIAHTAMDLATAMTRLRTIEEFSR